jgi:hypothetical protein
VGYVQYPGSDCLNGGVIRVPDGPKLMESLSSHHAIVLVGHHPTELRMVGELFGLRIETIGR